MNASKSTSFRNKMFGGFCGQLFWKHQACLRYNFKESGSRRKSWSISHMFYISYVCLPDFFFLIKKGKMGQPKRIFTTVRINTRLKQPHKLHFWSLLPPLPLRGLKCPWLEPSQSHGPGDCPSILPTARTCSLSIEREEGCCDPKWEDTASSISTGHSGWRLYRSKRNRSNPAWLHEETTLLLRKYHHPRGNSEDSFKQQLMRQKSLLDSRDTSGLSTQVQASDDRTVTVPSSPFTLGGF